MTKTPGSEPEHLSWGRIFWRRFKRHRLAMVGVAILLVLYLVAALAPQIAPYPPNRQNILNRFKPPSRLHLFGTDMYGRDIFSRVVHGARISLSVGFVSMGIAVTIGTTIGALAGYYGGWVDNALMRLTDIVISFPVLFLILTVVAIIGPSIFNIMAVIGLTAWPGTARLVRGQFLSLRAQDFTEAARALGTTDRRIIFRHILPNSMAPIIVAATLGVATAILVETALSYLGIGVQPPQASWGNILYEGQSHMRRAWWYTVFPGAFIFLTVLSFNMVGDALRDALDPRLKE
ncbi:MAG: oligopeptide ABC transporter permease [Bacillota bacterium]